MLVKELLDAINDESETMIIEWAENEVAAGTRCINDDLESVFDEYKIREEDRKVFIAQLRGLILLDMAIGIW